MAQRARVVEDDEDEVPDEETDLEEGRMPFLEHLRELRTRVKRASLAFIAAFLICWYFAHDIYQWLRAPLFEVWDAKKLGEPNVVFGRLTEPFWVDMSIGMWAGIFVGSPFIFYQLWKFIAPGLYKRERKIATAFAVFSALFFVVGALFCYYFVLKNLYGFLLGYGDSDLKPMIMMQDYLDLTRDMMLAFGAVFELPLLLYFLGMIGLVTHRSLWKFNRYFIVIAFVVGAILTPSPDAVSQIMMATPMVVLYNLSILLVWRVTAKRERKQAAERAAEEARNPKKKKKVVVIEEEDDDEYEYEDVEDDED